MQNNLANEKYYKILKRGMVLDKVKENKKIQVKTIRNSKVIVVAKAVK